MENQDWKVTGRKFEGMRIAELDLSSASSTIALGLT